MINLAPLEPHIPILKKLADLSDNDELYLVGGAVRDLLLGRKILDLDFTLKGSGIRMASQASRKLKGAFVPLSEKDDEARVVLRKELILDFRGFRTSILDDLADRDFTINAMALPLKSIINGDKPKLIDPFGGINDLRKRVIKTTGASSISNDPLRIFRAFRFAAQLNGNIHPSLLLEAERTLLNGVARERIAYEFMMIMACTPVYHIINQMITTGLLQQIFPFPQFWNDFQVRSHSLLVLATLDRILTEKRFSSVIQELINDIMADSKRLALLKIAALFHDVSKPETRIRAEDGSMHFYGHDTRGAKKMRWALSKIMRFSNEDSERVQEMVARHMHLHLIATAPQLTERAMRRFTRTCENTAKDIMILDLADGFATAGRTRHLERTIVDILNLAAEDAKRAAFVPLVNGHDLINMGLKPGPLFKKILSELEELQWERKITTKEEGLKLIREKIASGEYSFPEPN